MGANFSGIWIKTAAQDDKLSSAKRWPLCLGAKILNIFKYHGIQWYDLEFLLHSFASKSSMLSHTPNTCSNPESKVHGANMGPTWVLSAPGGEPTKIVANVITFEM